MHYQALHNPTTNLSLRQTISPSFLRVVYVWTLITLAMIVYVIVWFSMGLTVMTFIDVMAASASFADPWNQVLEFIRNCFLVHPIIALVGWFIYGIVNSMRRTAETWQ